ncbi:GGDEF domain-containing protein [Sphingomonas nostoxanthinifaciens]|uniref:GGDEF domain-containing protein n=1 Tax=Sphingomonas nostoxanthinifaciens TaxID=2872652 RepID=UPI001CC21F31|nr:GGDEF domain-containing protein [Sphingomonas nostoxanthinifaciens]UAK25406.1 GGDEF domain-containing protein [Sphingomonas nostoxanthinifaciens]
MVAVVLAMPLAVAALFAAALASIWRGRRAAAHAASWAGAFVMLALGWLAVLARASALDRLSVVGLAPNLCWLAAALGLVHGLRQRAGRHDRAGRLGAIWVAIALAFALLADVAPALDGAVVATIALLTGLGLICAAVAVGPRRLLRQQRFDWLAAILLGCFALANLIYAGLLLAGVDIDARVAAAGALVAALGYVVLGLGAVLMLNRDLCVALERLARTDPLTGVWNRRGFDEAAPHLLARLRARGGGRAAVAIADIDSFKAINDRFGHTVGDAVLRSFAATLGQAVRSGDLLARLGGEEFALLAIDTDADELVARVEEVRAQVRLPHEDRAGLPPVTASFGVAALDPETLALRDGLERADRALYRAKRTGRDRTVLDGSPDAPAE